MCIRSRTTLALLPLLLGCGDEPTAPRVILREGLHSLQVEHTTGSAATPGVWRYTGRLEIEGLTSEQLLGEYSLDGGFYPPLSDPTAPVAGAGPVAGVREGSTYVVVLTVHDRVLTLALGPYPEWRSEPIPCTGTWRPLVTTSGNIGPSPLTCQIWIGE